MSDHRVSVAVRAASALALALWLGGCASGGWDLTQGGLVDSATAFGSDQATSFTCRRWDAATGNLTDEVVVQRNLNPNAATVAAVADIAQAAIAMAKAVPAAPMAARPGAAPGSRLDVSSCLGEHGVNTPMPLPPNPMPPQQGGQQQSAHEPGTRPYALAGDPFGPPYLDADGVAHCADEF